MSTEITGTETVASSLRRIKLGAQVFRVPTTPTIRYMFWMRGFLKRMGDNSLIDEDLDDCFTETVAFLRRYNDKVDEDALQDIELADLISFYPRCFGADAEDGEPEGDGRPPRSTRSGTAKRTGRSQSTRR